jgi:hypothetical protein
LTFAIAIVLGQPSSCNFFYPTLWDPKESAAVANPNEVPISKTESG